MQARTETNTAQNRIGISVLRVSAGDSNTNSGFISTSSILATEDCAKKRIRLGNDNYVISIEPFKENLGKPIDHIATSQLNHK